MFRFLIVDDEAIIVNGIEASVDWRRLGVGVVETALNMRQAKEAFANRTFDVMISDIEMPQGSGLELFAWVRAHYPKTECIFLTCHAEFTYAKQAIQLGGYDYLLKPVPTEELERTVLNVLSKIRKGRDDEAKLVERFWLAVLHQEVPARPDSILKQAEHYRLAYSPASRLLPVLIQHHDWNRELGTQDENIMLYALRKAADELVTDHFAGAYTIRMGEAELILLIPCGISSDQDEAELLLELRHRCRELLQTCQAYFYCQLACMIGRPALLSELASMYDKLGSALRHQANAANRVLLLDEYGQAGRHAHVPDMKLWAELLRSREANRLQSEIRTLLDRWKQMNDLDTGTLRQFYQLFLQMVLHTLQKTGLKADEILHEHLSPERGLSATRSVAWLQEWVEEVIEKAVASMKALESSESIIEKIKRYIELHLDEELSRQYIADYVGLNPDYVVRIFKKSTGVSISDYIWQERMERAKELLIKSDMSISQVAISVGYPNFSYFSTLFRKSTAMTPQDYRKIHA
ncbi:response regulator [Paenibacillus lutimineralis]|nr:response regulator [Paenibacillus lutimineralis]